jgi:hypothetical protein
VYNIIIGLILKEVSLTIRKEGFMSEYKKVEIWQDGNRLKEYTGVNDYEIEVLGSSRELKLKSDNGTEIVINLGITATVIIT